MKTDYAGLGKEALAHLRDTAGQAQDIQIRLLMELLRKNCHTDYGRRYQFERIATVREYQDRVPVSAYNDYEAYIARIIDGEQQVLSRAPAIYFCLSSGTMGAPKYLPLTEAEMDISCIYIYGLIFGMAREYYSHMEPEEIFGKIFQIGEFAKTCMPDGRMNGIRSGAVYQWMDRNGQFDASDYCVPKEVLFPDELLDLLYVKVRFALAERNLRAIHGVFINRIAGMIRYICRNWDMLLRDMECGSVDESVDLPDRWKAYVREHLPPDPQRAQELRAFSCDTLSDGIIKKLWPQVRYILAIGGKAFSYYTEKVKEYAGGIPIHYYAYASTEGIFGISRNMDEPDAYILFPEAGFFEFLPVQEREEGVTGRPYLLWELEKGRQYELVFTNHSGLYRYRMGDVIEVVDWYLKAPVVRFCYRINQIINLAGEKTNAEQLEEAVSRFAEKAGCTVKGYCVQENDAAGIPGYLFYMECEGGGIKDAGEVLEECMCEVNYDYQGCRSMHEIGALRIAFLRSGSFERYEKRLAAQGRNMGQSKLLRILDSEEKRQFFAAERIVEQKRQEWKK